MSLLVLYTTILWCQDNFIVVSYIKYVGYIKKRKTIECICLFYINNNNISNIVL